MTSNWGGKRANSGRKRKATRKKPETKIYRMLPADAEFVKSGKLKELKTLIWEWKWRMMEEPKTETSPRWEKFREFIANVEEIYNTEEIDGMV